MGSEKELRGWRRTMGASGAPSCICADGSKGERRLAPMVQAMTAREPHVRHQNIPER